MRLTLATMRGGIVWDEEPPPGAEEFIARHLPTDRPLASYSGESASRVAATILRDVMVLPPSPKLMVLLANLQTIERREGSRVTILR